MLYPVRESDAAASHRKHSRILLRHPPWPMHPIKILHSTALLFFIPWHKTTIGPSCHSSTSPFLPFLYGWHLSTFIYWLLVASADVWEFTPPDDRMHVIKSCILVVVVKGVVASSPLLTAWIKPFDGDIPRLKHEEMGTTSSLYAAAAAAFWCISLENGCGYWHQNKGVFLIHGDYRLCTQLPE